MEQGRKKLQEEALAFARVLAGRYYVQRGLHGLSRFMDEQVSWIGTGEGEISHSLTQAKEALNKELEEYGGSFVLCDQWFEAVPRSNTLCVVYGTIHALPNNDLLAEERLRLSLVLEKTKQGIKIVHAHLSHADADQEVGRCFVQQSARSNNQALRSTLDLRSRQLEILSRNFPGGAHQCKNDTNMTFISVSDSFLSMFGYSYAEIETVFHSHFVEMVHPSDRASMIETMRAQLKNGRDIELEYRMQCKSGTPVWVLEKGRLLEDGNGGETFCCLLIEISQRKQAQEELRLTLERHQVIVDQASDIIFEWDIQSDTLSFSRNWRKRFGYDPIDTKISGRIPLSNNIHPNDIAAFVQLMQDTAMGVPYSETEFRIQSITGQYYWCRIRATAQFDANGRPIKAVGVITDIDREKKHKQALLDLALKDALTGLYNKVAVNGLAERRMQECTGNAMQALFILDIDYFKQVNDTYGHLAGDTLLSDVAAVIKTHLDDSDLAGRIGGDEFLIYIPEVASEAAARERALKLLAALTKLSPEAGAAAVSCSVGAAVFPQGAQEYLELYKCADLALYAQKNHGRGGVSIYNAEMRQQPQANAERSAVGPNVGADNGVAEDEHLAQYVFRRLYSVRDMEPTINRLLEIIGRSYDVSRAYVFESSEDGLRCSNTFEWCADGIAAQIEQLQELSYLEDLDDYQKNFDENGLFYCARVCETRASLRAVLEPQGIHSMLQCAMLEDGAFVGYVGFDECRNDREWSQQQVTEFKLTADVLSTFVVRLRLKQKLARKTK